MNSLLNLSAIKIHKYVERSILWINLAENESACSVGEFQTVIRLWLVLDKLGGLDW